MRRRSSTSPGRDRPCPPPAGRPTQSDRCWSTGLNAVQCERERLVCLAMLRKTGSMYRDGSTRVDEHDRAIGAVLIAEAVLASCEDAAGRMTAVTTLEADRWRAVMEVHDTYPEIWRHLDRARRELAPRGTNTIAYDELRPNAP